MALTYTKRQEQTAQQQTPVTSKQQYNGMQGVSQNTANNLGNYQSGYKPSETAQQAQQRLQQVEAQKPQSYSSKYAPQLDSCSRSGTRANSSTNSTGITYSSIMRTCTARWASRRAWTRRDRRRR